MAFLKIRNVNTLEEYEIKIGSCILYGAEKNGEIVQNIKDGGYMYVITNGDIFTDIMPFDTWIQNEYIFVDSPEYGLKATLATPNVFRRKWIYSTGTPSETEITITERVAYVALTHNGSIVDNSFTYLTDVSYSVSNGAEVNYEFLPVFPDSNAEYKPCIMMDRINQSFYLYSPHSVHIYNMVPESPKASIGDLFGYVQKITPPFQFDGYLSLSTDYVKLGVPRTAFPASGKVLTYADVGNADFISRAASKFGANMPVFSTFNWNLNKYVNIGFNNMKKILFGDSDIDDSENPYPNPTPPTPSLPDPDPPPYEGGGGEHNDDSDPVEFPDLPNVNPVSTGAVTLYQMAPDIFRSFLQYIWDDPKFLTIAKILTDPMDAVLSAHLITVNVPISSTSDIIVGNINSEIKANKVPNNFIVVDFGSIDISEYYGDADDYETVVQIYLPYYGYATLNTYEVMGATIQLKYYIDVLSGSFAALISVTKNTKGTSLSSVLYQYNGAMAYQVPLSSQSMTGIIDGIMGLVQLRPNISDFHVGYERASSLSGNTGLMAIKKAYISIMRPIHTYTTGRNKFIGYPYQQKVVIGNMKGYTKCVEVFIDDVIGTPEETGMIKEMLLQGVIL